jgi:hypothetical protein
VVETSIKGKSKVDLKGISLAQIIRWGKDFLEEDWDSLEDNRHALSDSPIARGTPLPTTTRPGKGSSHLFRSSSVWEIEKSEWDGPLFGSSCLHTVWSEEGSVPFFRSSSVWEIEKSEWDGPLFPFFRSSSVWEIEKSEWDGPLFGSSCLHTEKMYLLLGEDPQTPCVKRIGHTANPTLVWMPDRGRGVHCAQTNTN